MLSFKQFQQAKIQQIELALDTHLPAQHIEPKRLHEAMRYSTLNGGKRMRAMLIYATGHLLNQPTPILDSIASAIELIHAYSLIHDDLPCMDDDDLRRGKPSCHIQFDEATAILAGDALLTLAFKVMINANATAEQKLSVIQHLSQAAGSRGMVGGQAIDLSNEGQTITIAELESMHLHKTGALICACITMVASLQYDSSNANYRQLKHYAECIGLAFQVQDDILDETSSTDVLGKTQGKDQQTNKATYPALLGLKSSKQLANDLYEDAIASLSQFDKRADYLRQIAEFTVSRLA
ncbi:MAG: geranyl transferase [Piscirickettsiaceae bacterium]|nr:MAG: geranyl transferase [Piscirickettsiaceae bacterium]PCI68040.1 MAG: geranyl transferase [Piscirickettsiaceae bacterium]